MEKFKTKLIKRHEVARETMAFYFSKPEGYEFKAGQHIEVSLDELTKEDDQGKSRIFTIASAPADDFLMVATRMRGSGFKETLKAMPLESELEISEAMGSLTLHSDSDKKAVFLIGGIGITPVRSILFDATNKGLQHELFLFYSNRMPEDAPFLKEFESLQTKNPNFHLVATMTNLEDSVEQWNGYQGRINKELVKDKLSNTDNAIFYMAGPQGMVKSMQGLLEEMGVSEDNIKTEAFSGY